MNVQQLIKALSECPMDMEVIVNYNSDYDTVKSLKVIKAVKQSWGVMCSHPRMSPENKSKETDFLFIDNLEE